MHMAREAEDVALKLRLPLGDRSSVEALNRLRVASASGKMVPLGELGTWEKSVRERSIYHKNLAPVVFVTADVAGREESPVYPILNMNQSIAAMKLPEGYRLETYTARQPSETDRLGISPH